MSKYYESINEYIDEFPADVQSKLYELRTCILNIVPEAEELFNYGIPAFAFVEGGKREDQVMIAGYKNHVGFYPHPTTIEHFSEELKSYKIGKGSVQFQINEELPVNLIKSMLKFRYELIKTKYDL